MSEWTNNTGKVSVTTVLSMYIDKTWFNYEHRNRGAMVHDACASFLLAQYNPPLPDEYSGYFNSFMTWIDQIKKLHLVERRLVDDVYGYSGKIDLVATLKKYRGPVQVDIKTSEADSRWWRLQSAGYRRLYDLEAEKTGEKPTVKGISLRLRKTGGPPLITAYPSDYRRDLNIFLGGVGLYRFLNEGTE